MNHAVPGQQKEQPRSTPQGSGLAVIAFAALLAACAEPKVSLAGGPREYTNDDYLQVLERWTRSNSLMSLRDLDTTLTVTATFESEDFRSAYVARYATDYRLTAEQRRALLDKSLSEARDGHRFYVALYGSAARYTDLTSPNSAWVVRLIDDAGHETAPLSIDRVVRPGPLDWRYFPYSTVWRQVFRIKFSTTLPSGQATIPAEAHWFGLRFSGAEGTGDLRWKVGDAPPQARAGVR